MASRNTTIAPAVPRRNQIVRDPAAHGRWVGQDLTYDLATDLGVRAEFAFDEGDRTVELDDRKVQVARVGNKQFTNSARTAMP